MYHKYSLTLFSLFVSYHFRENTGMDIFSPVVVGMSGLYALWRHGQWTAEETCDHNWIINDFDGLAEDFETKVHGQHLVTKIVLRALKNHLQNDSPAKALVLSFHGRTGCGKNHVANLTAHRIFKQGSSSSFFKLWIAKLHFLHESKLEEYQDTIQSTIYGMVRKCPRSMFVFDEADHLHAGLVDTLKPFLDYHHELDGVDFRKATFIFLSNTGSKKIADVAYDYKVKARKREEITMKDIEPLIRTASFNEKGGLQNSALTKNVLIDLYVPFLPLEKKHILLCVKDYLARRGCVDQDKLIDEVTEMMEYEPPELYSKNGCKSIESKINILLMDDEC